MIKEIQLEMASLGNATDAASSQRYFKTGAGEYGEGDVFRGIRVPVIRQVVKNYRQASLQTCTALLDSEYHEDRLLGLLILVAQFQQGNATQREPIHTLYLTHAHRVNNWDLVDSSAEHLVGGWLWDKDRSLLYQLARSTILWERRIAVLATFYFIRKGEYTDTLQLAEMLLQDPEDLMHKAVGWMLREVAKREQGLLERFLQKYTHRMPRTMLRYAIEKFPEELRQQYLHQKEASS